jgi:glycogen synthase
MTDAHSIQQENGRYGIRPVSFECYGVSFKSEAEADHVARALNKAFKLGQESVRAELRALIGAASKEDIE